MLGEGSPFLGRVYPFWGGFGEGLARPSPAGELGYMRVFGGIACFGEGKRCAKLTLQIRVTLSLPLFSF